MKLIFYSGGQQRSNHKLHEAVVKLAKKGRKTSKKLKFTYIPFCSDHSAIYFQRCRRRYQRHGVESFQCLPVDVPLNQKAIRDALSSDIIYLAGGNTFYFLKHLKKSGMFSHLQKFAKSGGVIVGLSAGGLIMTPTIRIAGDATLGPDENQVRLKDHRGLNLTQFEFSPHFDGSEKEIRAHLNYSLKTPYPVYAICDGGGIIVNGDRADIIGGGSVFSQGQMLGWVK